MQAHQFFAGNGLRQRLVKVNELRFISLLHLEEFGALDSIQLDLGKISHGRARELKDYLDRADSGIAVFVLPMNILLSYHICDPAYCV